jgi:hypothetical protein
VSEVASDDSKAEGSQEAQFLMKMQSSVGVGARNRRRSRFPRLRTGCTVKLNRIMNNQSDQETIGSNRWCLAEKSAVWVLLAEWHSRCLMRFAIGLLSPWSKLIKKGKGFFMGPHIQDDLSGEGREAPGLQGPL